MILDSLKYACDIWNAEKSKWTRKYFKNFLSFLWLSHVETINLWIKIKRSINLCSKVVSEFRSGIREGNGSPLQYSRLENLMDEGAWWAVVHGVAKSRTRLSNFTFTFHFHTLEKEMATHSSILAWRIPGMGEPGRLLSMGSHRIGHDWSDLAAAAFENQWSKSVCDKITEQV